VLYARATRWLGVPYIERRLALIAFVFTLPALAMGLHADDYILREQVLEGGPFAAYLFDPLDRQAAHARVLEERAAGRAPWWADEHQQVRFFRPLTSLSLWLDFEHGAPVWWMHLENGAIFAAIVWLAVALYKQLGLSGAGLGWAAVFFGLDGALATSVGWIACRNTLLAVCFALACLLLHDRARRAGRPLLLVLSSLCFALSLASGELGLCVLGYLGAHALIVDRAPRMRRALALAPYAAVTSAYLVHYVTAGYGASREALHRDVLHAPAAALLAWIEEVPVWLATTATAPVATLPLLIPELRWPVLAFSLVVLVVLLRLLGSRSIELPHARMLAIGALLSLVPLVTAPPQDRLRFFVAFGIYGVLGPWVASHYDAPERFSRGVARVVWRVHAVWLPLLFVPVLFSISSPFGSGAARALDDVLPRQTTPITIVLNPPSWTLPWYQSSMRAARGEIGPPVFALYAGSQSLDIQRLDDRSLELHVARSWFAAPFNRVRDLSLEPFRAGDRIPLAHLTVEVREVDEDGAPTRARFTFDRSLDDAGLSFRYWHGTKLALWTPPPTGGRVQLSASSALF